MAETSTANTNTNQKTTASNKQARSKKRRFGGQQDGNRKKRKFNSFDVDLTKNRNIILCSCQKFKEKSCGRDLKLVFTEYIEEFMKENNIEKQQQSNTNNTNSQDNSNEDDDLKVKAKDSTNSNDAKTENDSEKNNENEDIDLKDANEKANGKAEINVADAIKNELANLDSDSLCEWIQGPDGLVIIDILKKDVPASKLLEFIFTKSYPNRPNLSPFVFKLYPMDVTTFARQDDIMECAKKEIEKINWDSISKSDTWAINYKNRANKQLDRNTLIDGIASCVPDGYKVDLSNPQIVILLQTFGRTAGVSVIVNGIFNKHKEYNLGNFET